MPGAAGLKAWVASHQMVLAGGAGAVVLGVAAKSRKAKGGGGAAAPSQIIAPSRNDSTGTDVYNSIEPQIEFLRGQIDQMGQQVSKPQDSLKDPGIPPPLAAVPPPVAAVTPTAPTVVPVTPAPVAAPPPAPAPASNWGVNDPATNPHVSPSPPVYLAPTDTLPAATGTGQRYQTPDGFQFTYG